jgi:precorrin-4 methylase
VDQLTTLKYISCVFSCHALALIIRRQARKAINLEEREREREIAAEKTTMCIYILLVSIKSMKMMGFWGGGDCPELGASQTW